MDKQNIDKLVKLEELSLFICSLYLFSLLDFSWLLFILLFLIFLICSIDKYVLFLDKLCLHA